MGKVKVKEFEKIVVPVIVSIPYGKGKGGTQSTIYSSLTRINSLWER